jgi:hypothetical protein
MLQGRLVCGTRCRHCAFGTPPPAKPPFTSAQSGFEKSFNMRRQSCSCCLEMFFLQHQGA